MSSEYYLTYMVKANERFQLEYFASEVGFKFWGSIPGVLGYRTIWPEEEKGVCLIGTQFYDATIVHSTVIFDSKESCEAALSSDEVKKGLKALENYGLKALPEIFVGELKHQWGIK